MTKTACSPPTSRQRGSFV